MMLSRRYFAYCVAAVLTVGLGGVGLAQSTRIRQRGNKATKVYPPFLLQAIDGSLEALRSGLVGIAVQAHYGRVSAVWLKNDRGRFWVILVDSRDPEFMFEVFAVAVTSLEELRARTAAWTPPPLPKDAPEGLKQLFARKPALPTAPETFEPWPFRRWRCEVLHRNEFIIKDAEVGPTFGMTPNLQSGAKPGAVPPEADASCEVAVGLLFTGENGLKLLAAVGEMPLDLICTQDAAEIDAYLEGCAVLPLAGSASPGR